MIKKIFLVNCIVILVHLTGCIGIYPKDYKSPDLKKDDIVTITGDKKSHFFHNSGLVLIKAVDGMDIGNFWRGWPRRISVLPGLHRLDIEYEERAFGVLSFFSESIVSDSYERKLEIETYQGHEYLIKFKKIESHPFQVTYIVYWVEDLTTGQVVTGEKPLN